MKTQCGPVVPVEARSIIAVRVPLADEVEWFDGLLASSHYLGAGQPVGDYLRQVVERDGKAVALLVWGPACYALKDRDLWISWSATQRLERLKLIVQNRRFLVLAPKGESPNLASQAMGAALRALPDLWREHFGYRPLLAESFTDPELMPAPVTRRATGKRWVTVRATADIVPTFTFPMTGPSGCGCVR